MSPSTRRWLELLAVLPLALGTALIAHAMCVPGLIGFGSDEAIYALAARALALGQGYVDLALPGLPPVPRYPPGLPALLAPLAWGVDDPWAQARRLQWAAHAFAAAYVAAGYLYLRRAAGWDRGLAWAGALLLASYPLVAGLSVGPLSDVPFAAVALGSLALIQRAAGGSRPGLDVAAGMLAGVATLLRYPGVCLLAGALAGYAPARDGRGFARVAAGFAGVLAPWVVWGRLGGSAAYGTEAASRLPADAGAWAAAAGLAVGHACTSLAGFFGATGPAGPAAWPGAIAIALVAAGAWRLRRERGAAIATGMIAATLALALAYDMVYGWYGESLVARLCLPVLPCLLAALGGLADRFAHGRKALFAALLAGSLAHGVWQAELLRGQARVVAAWQPQELFTKLFAATRARTPVDAVLAAPVGHMVSFYTGRVCLDFPRGAAGGAGEPGLAELPAFVAFLRAQHVGYLVGFPDQDKLTHVDRTVRLVNALAKAYPEALEPVYVDGPGHMAIFQLRLP